MLFGQGIERHCTICALVTSRTHRPRITLIAFWTCRAYRTYLTFRALEPRCTGDASLPSGTGVSCVAFVSPRAHGAGVPLVALLTFRTYWPTITLGAFDIFEPVKDSEADPLIGDVSRCSHGHGGCV